jgi:hypothetical protein
MHFLYLFINKCIIFSSLQEKNYYHIKEKEILYMGIVLYCFIFV